MNRLARETSPYLLQHATNPVDWYAWRPEAFAAAREKDLPILVSIGYSTCHWCHVMERESFEQESVAAFMNTHFINIKVDREERPDVDQIYMDACQAIHGSGGWPLNCFLTPDGKPFFAGTYYPPRPAHNRPAWLQLLKRMADAYRQRRDQVEAQAKQLTEMIERSDRVFLDLDIGGSTDAATGPQREMADAMLERLVGRVDRDYGGFGHAPKFPSTMALDLMMRYSQLSGKEEPSELALFSLDQMVRGGIYDQLGGGFARYATDRAWLVPHFEKMLYDNALLIGLLANAYRKTGEPFYRDSLKECVDFVRRDLLSPEGGFYAAFDADSEGEEGKYYVWSAEEIGNVLGKDAPLFMDFYGLSEEGNWEGKNILWRPKSLRSFADERGLDPERLARSLADSRKKLLAVRQERVPPGRDEKIILSWNALMAGALAQAGAALADPELAQLAAHNLNFLLDELGREDGGLWHVYKDGKSQYPAFLDDYAHLIEALITTYECTFEISLLEEATRLTEWVVAEFGDPEGELFYYTSSRQKDLIMRKRELYDSATPSGNATMADNLIRLGLLLGRPNYTARAEAMLERMLPAMRKYPESFSRWALALLRLIFPPAEIAVVGPDAKDLAFALGAAYLPNAVWMAAESEAENYPLLAGKGHQEDTLIYVCRDYACRHPVSSIEEALKLVND